MWMKFMFPKPTRGATQPSQKRCSQPWLQSEIPRGAAETRAARWYNNEYRYGWNHGTRAFESCCRSSRCAAATRTTSPGCPALLQILLGQAPAVWLQARRCQCSVSVAGDRNTDGWRVPDRLPCPAGGGSNQLMKREGNTQRILFSMSSSEGGPVVK